MSSDRLKDEDVLDGLWIWYLKTSGLWRILNDQRENGKRSWIINFWVTGMAVFCFPYFVLSFVGPFYSERDIQGLTLVVLNSMSLFQQAVRLILLWFYVEKQAKLLDMMKKGFLTCVDDDLKYGVDKILGKSITVANFVAKLITSTNIIVVGTWNFWPVLRSEFFRTTLGVTLFGTPVGPNKIVGVWYPIDVSQSPTYEIIYFCEFVGCAWTGFIITLTECLTAQTIALYTGYLHAFKYLIGNMKSSQDPKLDKENLLRHVHEHKRLMRIGQDLCEIYELGLTFEIAAGYFILIFTIFNVIMGSGSGDVAFMAKFFIFAMYTLVEISVYCVLGNELETTCEEVSVGAYFCSWYEKNTDFRKTLLMLMIRTKTPVVMKFGNVYPINLNTLTNILQTAYSTSMILYRAKEPDAV